VEGILVDLETWSVAKYFLNARWGYAFLNAFHIFGIALLIGATVSINLRLLGFWPNIYLSDAARILVPIAAIGLGFAIVSGTLLFSVRAREYADLGFFQIKILLVFVGAVSAISLHWRFGMLLEGITHHRRISHAILSLICWPGALVLGRLIAFADS